MPQLSPAPLPPLKKITIEDSFKLFVANPLFAVTNVACHERETALDLLRSYICYNGGFALVADEAAILAHFCDLPYPERKAFHQLFTPVKIPLLIDGFISFLASEMMPVASQKFVRSVCQSVEEYCLWLVKHEYVELESGEEAAYRLAEAARELPKAMRALKRLHTDLYERQQDNTAAPQIETFKIVKLGGDSLWLNDEDNQTIGPVKVGEKVRRELKIGWELRCSLLKRTDHWQIADLGGIRPREL